MTDHLISWTFGVAAAISAALVAAVATRVQLLPEVIDVSVIPTGAGLGGLALTFYGAVRRYEPDRLGRVALLGNLGGASLTTAALAIFLVVDVFS